MAKLNLIIHTKPKELIPQVKELRLGLEYIADSVFVVATKRDGTPRDNGLLLQITEKGRVKFCSGVSKKFGLDLNNRQELKLDNEE